MANKILIALCVAIAIVSAFMLYQEMTRDMFQTVSVVEGIQQW